MREIGDPCSAFKKAFSECPILLKTDAFCLLELSCVSIVGDFGPPTRVIPRFVYCRATRLASFPSLRNVTGSRTAHKYVFLRSPVVVFFFYVPS